MVDAYNDEDIKVFKDALLDENISIQVDAIRRLPALAGTMDGVRLREELIPYIVNCLESLPGESCYNLAEQLERLVPVTVGCEHAGAILDILLKLISEDETILRERAVEAMNNICSHLSNEQCEQFFFPMFESLTNSDWFTSKCSAGCLITICYSKMPPEKQTELRNLFRNLIQDDSPIVRRSIANNLINLIPHIEEEEIKSEIVPVFDNLSQDEQDTIRTLAVDVGIAVSKKLKDFEIYEYLLKTFKLLGADESWRVRQRVAMKIHEIKSSEKNREEIINIYKHCVHDEELEVRVFAAKNMFNFVANLAESYKSESNWEDVFEKNFVEVMISEIHYMITDHNDDVRVALSTNILSLSGILRDECFTSNILPLVIDALENDQFMPFKENMLKNLNSLPRNVDITKSIKSIKNVIQNLLENSQMHWRTRRNLLLAFTHIAKNTTKDFFDENLKMFYEFLLNDPIFAIRRTAPLILPVLIKQFGIEWARISLIPIFLVLSKDSRYLFRHVTLFGVDELITPTLGKNTEYYLSDLRELVKSSACDEKEKYLEILVRIIKLSQKLSAHFPIKHIDNLDTDISNIIFYAEDTFKNLKKEQSLDMYSISDNNSDCYLEGILLLLVKDFVEIIKNLTEDPITNVQDRAKITLNNIHNLSNKLEEELQDSWVHEAVNQLDENHLEKIHNKLEEELAPTPAAVQEEQIDCAEEEVSPEESVQIELLKEEDETMESNKTLEK